jgi:hypothetical protein
MTYIAALILGAIVIGIISAISDRKPRKQHSLSSSSVAIPYKLKDIPLVIEAERLLKSYNSYYVHPPHIPQYRGKTWQQKYPSIISRGYFKTDQIICDDLNAMRVSRTVGLRQAIETRIWELRTESQYPDPDPVSDISPLTPPQPLRLIDLKVLKELVKRRDASRGEKAQLLDSAEAINEKLKMEFSAATEKYNVQSAHLSKIIETVRNDWQDTRDLWNRERELELGTLNQFIFDFTGVKDVELVSRLILNALRLPSWIPNNFDVKYQPDNRILIVEHQLPNVEEVGFYKAVQLKTTLSQKPLNRRERREVVSEFYPLIALRIAIDIADQVPAAFGFLSFDYAEGTLTVRWQREPPETRLQGRDPSNSPVRWVSSPLSPLMRAIATVECRAVKI